MKKTLAPIPTPPVAESAITLTNTQHLAFTVCKQALQQMIAAGVLGNDPLRLKTENVFEGIRGDIARNEASLESLVAAADALVPVIDFLNNNSRADAAVVKRLTASVGILSKRAVLLIESSRK